MNKITYGLILGGILGIFDGLTSWFTPAVRPQLMGIVLGSTFKGLLAGVLIGIFARKVHSLASGRAVWAGCGIVVRIFHRVHAAELLRPDYGARRIGGPDRGLCDAEVWGFVDSLAVANLSGGIVLRSCAGAMCVPLRPHRMAQGAIFQYASRVHISCKDLAANS